MTVPTASEERAALVFALFAAAAFAAVRWWFLETGASFDLMPVWLAGKAWDMGLPIYSGDTTVFSLAPPEGWTALAEAEGYGEAELFPFIYPPLWAAVMAPVTRAVSWEDFELVFSLINPFLLVLTIWLCWRAAPVLTSTRHMVLGLVLLCATTVGLMAIIRNQVQIPVAFLLALTMERSRRDAQWAAGAALALAAALKLYPAVFAILFFATRQYRALAGFAVVGGGLGAMSLVLGGWSAHAALLGELSTISRTLLFINLSTNLDALILPFADLPMISIGEHRLAAAKTDLWAIATQASILALFGGLVLGARRRPAIAQHPALWPFAITAMACLGPLSWTYHYITPLAAAPLLFAYWSTRTTTLFLAVAAVLLSFLPIAFDIPAPFDAPPLQFWGSLSVLGLALAYGASLFRVPRQPG